MRRYGCVSGHHAPLPRAEAQGSDRAARRAPRAPRCCVSAKRRSPAARPAGPSSLHARHRTSSHGYGGRCQGNEERLMNDP